MIKTSFVLLVLFLFSGRANAQAGSELLRSEPETEDVSSEKILGFLDAVEKSKIELHSFMFLHHGKVIAEGWWYPYRSDLKHTMYSVSKSFTSTAIGFAVNEKRLSLSDKVISFFTVDVPDTISKYLSELTIKDLLTMSEGQEPAPTFTTITSDSNWIKTFLSLPIVNEPGTKFLYNSFGVYILSAIVQKATGQKVSDYLRPRLFEPLGIHDVEWDVDPQGINTGGWGLKLKTEDMAKFGQLYLQDGLWNGIRILPEGWVEEATRAHIEQSPGLPQGKKDLSDWQQGYGFLFWRCRHNAFRADGGFGQFIIAMPDEDAVIAITAETPDMQDEINLLWEHLVPAMHHDNLPPGKNMSAALNQKLSALALALPQTNSPAPLQEVLSNKTFTIEPNEKHIESMFFRFGDHVCDVVVKSDTAVYRFAFGSGTWKIGETTKPGPSIEYDAKTRRAGVEPHKVAGSYSWKDQNRLELILRYIESPHTEKMLCCFDHNNIVIEIRNSFEPENAKTVLTGRLTE